MVGFKIDNSASSKSATSKASEPNQPNESNTIYATLLSNMVPPQEIPSGTVFEELVDLVLAHLHIDGETDVEMTVEKLASWLDQLKMNEAQQAVNGSSSQMTVSPGPLQQPQASGKIKVQHDPQELVFPVHGCPACTRLWEYIQDWMLAWGVDGHWRHATTQEKCKEVDDHMMVHKIYIELSNLTIGDK